MGRLHGAKLQELEMLSVAPHPDLPEDDTGSTLDPHGKCSCAQQREQQDQRRYRDEDVECSLYNPRWPMKIGIADSHDWDGADVVGHPGLGVEVMNPGDHEYFRVLTPLRPYRIDEPALLEASLGHQQGIRVRRHHGHVEISETP
jgi:hypothetical protein